jgi:hypothetical protein
LFLFMVKGTWSSLFVKAMSYVLPLCLYDSGFWAINNITTSARKASQRWIMRGVFDDHLFIIGR